MASCAHINFRCYVQCTESEPSYSHPRPHWFFTIAAYALVQLIDSPMYTTLLCIMHFSHPLACPGPNHSKHFSLNPSISSSVSPTLPLVPFTSDTYTLLVILSPLISICHNHLSPPSSALSHAVHTNLTSLTLYVYMHQTSPACGYAMSDTSHFTHGKDVSLENSHIGDLLTPVNLVFFLITGEWQP